MRCVQKPLCFQHGLPMSRPSRLLRSAFLPSQDAQKQRTEPFHPTKHALLAWPAGSCPRACKHQPLRWGGHALM